METRANHIWVGVITLLLLAAMAASIIWIARLGQGDRTEYDIFYAQSVSGLANGSQVAYAGVPVGQVIDIALSEENPEFVRVRVRVKEGVPILVGTTATIQASFTGVSTILLDGARGGAPPITCETTACPEDRPLIPPKDGGINALLNNAPLLLERLATLAENLNVLLGPENQEQISGILENSNQLTGELARAAPRIDATFTELEIALREAGETLDAFEKTAGTTNELLSEEAPLIAAELRGTLRSANEAATALATTLDEARPITQQLQQSTLPTAEATLQDLRTTSRSLRAITERLENQGAGSLISGQTLPDYEP